MFSFQHLYPKSQIDVFVKILEDDGCTLASALTVASLALSDAGIQMFDLLVGTSLVSFRIWSRKISLDKKNLQKLYDRFCMWYILLY